MAQRRTLASWQGKSVDDSEPHPGSSDDAITGPEPELLIRAPARARIVLTCPDCGADATIAASMFARRVKDSDGTITLALRVKAAKLAHGCDQLTLDAAATGELVR